MKSSKIALIVFLSTVVSLFQAAPSRAQEACGFVSKQTRQLIDAPRFRFLVEYGGRAFIDMQSCLVWRLEVMSGKPTLTLDDAMRECGSLGQGGPHGEMGWQLPTLAELTSLDSEDWAKQQNEFDQYKIPPLIRTEAEFWTSTPWLGRPGSWAVVQFSALTTVVRPVTKDSKAAVWCIRGYPARGLR
jgi:hypothetical protein